MRTPHPPYPAQSRRQTCWERLLPGATSPTANQAAGWCSDRESMWPDREDRKGTSSLSLPPPAPTSACTASFPKSGLPFETTQCRERTTSWWSLPSPSYVLAPRCCRLTTGTPCHHPSGLALRKGSKEQSAHTPCK